MATPLNVPRRPKWRYEPVTTVGRRIVPAIFNQNDRARIDERMNSKVHDNSGDNANERDGSTD